MTKTQVIAERIARHYLDAERASVSQFSDIVDAIDRVLQVYDKAVADALRGLQSEHVKPNLFRLGLLGKQEVEQAIETLHAVYEIEP